MPGISKVKIKRASGKVVIKYRITYRDIYGKQHTSKLYDTKKEAQKDLYKYEKFDPDKHNLAIGKMFEVYMEDAKTRHSKTTLADTEAYIKNHFKALFNIKYEKFSPIDLGRFINKIAQEHTPNVANQALKKFKAVVSFCFNNGLIKENKFRLVKSIPVENKPHYPLEADEMITVLDNCKKLYPKHFAMIYTEIATGMRYGEWCALTVEDVHFETDNNYIHVCKQFTKGMLLPHTKTKDIRDVLIFDDLVEVLKVHIANLPKGSNLLFPNEAGNYQNPSNIRNRKWKPLLIYSGITKRVRMHDLRGSYINLTLSSGLSVKFTQEQVGHKEAGTTLNVYATCNKDMKKKAMEVLNEKFSKRNHM